MDYRGNSNNIYHILFTTDILRTAKLISRHFYKSDFFCPSNDLVPLAD